VKTSEWKNGTRLNWGTLPRGVNVTKDLTVYNLNDYSVTVYLIADLPPGWTLTWEANGAIIRGRGDLHLGRLDIHRAQLARPP
jgi:hypothetical protein